MKSQLLFVTPAEIAAGGGGSCSPCRPVRSGAGSGAAGGAGGAARAVGAAGWLEVTGEVQAEGQPLLSFSPAP